jgi:hypothetical protein
VATPPRIRPIQNEVRTFIYVDIITPFPLSAIPIVISHLLPRVISRVFLLSITNAVRHSRLVVAPSSGPRASPLPANAPFKKFIYFC